MRIDVAHGNGAGSSPQEEYKDLTKWWKEQLGSDVIGVKVSKRLANTPVVVVTSKHGWSANMERIMKAQVRRSVGRCLAHPAWRACIQ